ncbi:MAG: hypothetical protein Q9227_007461 [Pyrenula ochraceoflavens]
MRSAAHVFYLAVYTLFSPAHGKSQTARNSRTEGSSSCAVGSASRSSSARPSRIIYSRRINQIDPKAIVSDACATFSTLDTLNAELAPSLGDLTQNTDFFAYYRLNLFNKVCPFWDDANSMCGNRACAVDTLENEADIPPIWRAEELSKLEGLRASHPGKKQQAERPKAKPLQGMLGEDVDESCVLEVDDECDERDYCVPEDEGASAKGDYVSLINNTERFTGYAGLSAHHVWDAIYKENCFSKPLPSTFSSAQSLTFGAQEAASDFKSVLNEYGRQHLGSDSSDELDPLDDECLEQRAFYRIISGMHASISTHICWDYFNQMTGEWVRNTTCYKERLHSYPERISNLYFNFALVTRALAKLVKPLESYTFCTGDIEQDRYTKQKVLQLADMTASAPHTFDETLMFQDPAVLGLKEDFKQRFRNVSRIMDCVGCDKCRLWGKLQTAGYGAALKVLFEFDETNPAENPILRRTELVALVNTLGRISHSLTAISKFRDAVEKGYTKFHKDIPVPDNFVDTPHIGLSPDEGEEESELDYGGYEEPIREDPRSQQTIGEIFWEEFDAIWRAYKWVLGSWLAMPFKIWAIFLMEMNRLWNYWLGLPVPERSWDWKLPRREDLFPNKSEL